MLSSWNSEFKKLKSGEITKEEYDMWRYSYPRIKAERLHEEFKKLKNNTENNKCYHSVINFKIKSPKTAL